MRPVTIGQLACKEVLDLMSRLLEIGKRVIGHDNLPHKQQALDLDRCADLFSALSNQGFGQSFPLLLASARECVPLPRGISAVIE